MATVLESSVPCCMIRRHKGIISVVRRKLITCTLSVGVEGSFPAGLTRAPMTPSDVKRRYSKGRVLDVVLRNG